MTDPPEYHELAERITEATGTTAGPALDEELRGLYQRHPAVFTAKVGDILGGWEAGRIRNPWAFLRSEMKRVDTHRPTTEAAGPERERAIRLAETWIRNAGLYAPLTEAHADLFDRGGHLHPWHHDQQLEKLIVDAWTNEQPRAQAAAIETAERHARQAAHYHAAHPIGQRTQRPITMTERRQAAFHDTEPEPEHDPPPADLDTLTPLTEGWDA